MKTSASIQIKGFLETSFIDWPGKVCAVLFLPGCNFRCPFCHNGALVLDPLSLQTVPLEKIIHRLTEYEGWIDGVCITGGEPTIHPTLPALMQRFKDRNFAVKLDTNGTNPTMVEALIRDNLVDCVAMDIKGPLKNNAYSRSAGRPIDMDAITRSIGIIRSNPVEVFFRITVVPSLISEEEVYQIARYLAPHHRLVLQQFNPRHALDLSLRSLKPWPLERLDRVQRQVNIIGSEEAA